MRAIQCLFASRNHPTKRWSQPMPQPSTRGMGGISRRGHPSRDTALPNAAAQPDLYRDHTGQEAYRSRLPDEGRGDLGEKYLGTAALVEAG